ncbi:MarR family transcriptional regulator [Pontibacter sp. G13]|uniref:MarR family winged helix-turn-helix transcriptional regulator n=1 Tax=Pontibacter sp. G13 TaxID=3074898 RepID=UPI00288C3354|nr:MarR family transcriptional regulator [Pontibacter sp. G13]WNJ20755.1 MarR family transcriptional regulator [Pontibacter sp. G13]
MMDTAIQETAVERLEHCLHELVDVYRSHQNYIKQKYEISAVEMEIIQLIVLEGPKKMKEIGQHFNIKLSTLTSIIDKIERQKLVKRINSREDRRVVFLEVSRKGKTLYDQYSRYLHVISQKIKSSLTDSQHDALIKGLDRMTGLVEQAETA